MCSPAPAVQSADAALPRWAESAPGCSAPKSFGSLCSRKGVWRVQTPEKARGDDVVTQILHHTYKLGLYLPGLKHVIVINDCSLFIFMPILFKNYLKCTM